VARRRDFTGEKLGDPALVAATRANVTATPGTIQNLRLWPYPERRTMRVAFEVDPGSETLSELRVVLDAGGQPVSETLLNRWTW
jgi:periplasmic glucans biosynthesis protein